jgi:MerR family redox-sensitive transcriptional activator SoxR
MHLQVDLKSTDTGMLTIGQVAARAGIHASAIRYYESQGLLPSPPRIGGKRVYDASIFERLAVIGLAKLAGFSLAETKVMLSTVSRSGPAKAWRQSAKTKRMEINRQMRSLEITKYVLTNIAQCRCRSLDECGRAFRKALAGRRWM